MLMDQAEKLRDAIQAKNEEITKPRQLSSRVITVTSGKGGVGKSNFAANLSLAFKKMGKRVLILDADFGLANIELILGVIPKYNLADVLHGDRTVEDIITMGPLDIGFISGGSGLKELSGITDRQMRYIIHNFNYLDKVTDFIVIDTGAGISKSVINFVKASSETIVITTPEPTSITDAYALIKTVKEDYSGIVPSFKLVINKVESADEGEEVFMKLQKVSSKFLGIELEYLGSIPYDQYLVKAVKNQKPVSIAYPNSAFARASNTIGRTLIDGRSAKDTEAVSGILPFLKKLIGLS